MNKDGWHFVSVSPIDHSERSERSDEPEDSEHPKYLALLPNDRRDGGI